MHQGCLRIVFGILEAGNKVVAALAHANNLGTVQGQVQLVFVRLGKTAEDEGVVVARDNENNIFVLAAGVIVSDSESFGDFGESGAIVDNSDESATERIDGSVASKLKAGKASGIDDSICAVLGEELFLLVKKVSADLASLHDRALADQGKPEPVHVGIGIDDRSQVLIRVDNTRLLVDFVFPNNVGISPDTFDLEVLSVWQSIAVMITLTSP